MDMDTCCATLDAVNIFSAGAGKVVAMDDDTAIPLAFSVDGNDRLFNQLGGIATSVGINGQAGFQFMHSLREFIYVYVFTERMGEIVINGLAFPAFCDTQLGADATDANDEPLTPLTCVEGTTGLERIMTWYECNRITSRATPITIALGAEVTYNAFLVSVKADIANADTGIAQFSFKFNYVPRITDNDDFCFGLDDSCLDIPCTDGGGNSQSIDSSQVPLPGRRAFGW